MSKIVSMSSGAIDPINVTKRVFWRPETAATVLKVGQPVCYNSDSVQDHKERTADPTHIGLTEDTYAEGAQDFTGRLFIVEEPLTANLHAFAGIVKSLGSKAGADGDMIEIFTPVEGVIVPVYCAQNCINDRTIMGIRNGQADIDYIGRPIGVAAETKDRSTTDGLVWMKFRNFEYGAINGAGDATLNTLVLDDESVAGNVCVKSLNLRFDGTGRNRALFYCGEINGAGHCAYGMFKFRTYVSAALSQNAHCICANLIIRDNGELVDTPEFANACIYATVETEVASAAADMSGGSVCAIYIGYYVNEGVGAPANAFPFWFNNNNDVDWDGLLNVQALGDIGDYVAVGGAPTIAALSLMIPIKVAGTDYYLIATTDAATS